MTASDTKWYDRALASNIVGGLVVGFLIWAAPTALNAATKAKVPFWGYGLVALAAVLVMSFAIPIWRRTVWGNARRLAKWAAGLRILSQAQREGLVADGVAAREKALEKERAATKQPAWRILVGDTMFREANINWLHNSGHEAMDVEVTCDRDLFEIEGQAFYAGPFGTAGRQLLGLVTDRGEAEGIDFSVTWRDVHGDNQHTIVRVHPEDLRNRRQAAIDAARAAGVREGFKEGKDAARAEQETDATQALNLPAPAPRWTLTNMGEDTNGIVTYRVTNAIPGSHAYNVRMDHIKGGPFQFTDAAFWPNLSGTAEGSFRGLLKGNGRAAGATLQLSWLDEMHRPNETQFRIAPVTDSWEDTPF